MKNFQTQKGFAIPLLIAIIAVLVIGGGVYVFSKNFKPSEPSLYKNEALVSKYVVLNDVKLWSGKYVSTKTPIEWNVPSKNETIKKITESSFSCGNKQANFLNYSSYGAASNSMGGWNSVSVIDCGSYYFVYENSDAGPKLYGPFDIKTAVVPPVINSTPIKSSISVLSPNGGEVWAKGSQQNITWKPYNGLVTIFLVPHIPTPNVAPNSGVSAMPAFQYPTIKLAENVDGSTGIYSWTVTTSSSAGLDYVNGGYFIKICSNDGTMCSQSKSDFIIASSLDFQLQYSGMTATNKEYSVKYPITWTYYNFNCNSVGVAFWPMSSAPNFSQGSACSANGFINSAPIVMYTMSQPAFNLQDKNYLDVYNKMSASLRLY